ncbi:MAG: phosphodiester glycosidase family protein [Armatimonadota bacterium]|nr:phosphodiester glycosidase family protein [Armatimonadota bacterium]MDW8026627.1 phosphodiester glycosidase family protein [Armatimonadota bacterium]
MVKKRQLAVKIILLVLFIAVTAVLKHFHIGSLPIRLNARLDSLHPMSTLFQQGAIKSVVHFGVTHWRVRSNFDGTVLDLLEFDFDANPHLRFELYDQDEDDDVPFDNKAKFWHRGIGHVICHLNQTGRGKVIAAWNGLFFGYDRKRKIARHVAPVVLRGKVHYSNVGNHRWTFGVKYEGEKPIFKVLHLPDYETLEREFTFASGGAQCLVKDGKPLKLRPFSKPPSEPITQPVPSTSDEAGHIPIVDHIKTSRTSMGWSKNNRKLYLLVVKEPDREAISALALRFHIPLMGGWSVSDLQQFWLSMKIWGAVNIDGGDVAQMAFLRDDGEYEVVPPRWSTFKGRLRINPCLSSEPKGGALMYFYVADVSSFKP